jgi:hypothetical protein
MQFSVRRLSSSTLPSRYQTAPVAVSSDRWGNVELHRQREKLNDFKIELF